jgi:hypothetical protein
MLNVTSKPFIVECHYAECRYAKCHYAECRGSKLMLVCITSWLDVSFFVKIF